MRFYKYVFGRPYLCSPMFSMLYLEIWQRLPIRKRLPSFSGARNSLTLPPVVSASAICPHDELIYILIQLLFSQILQSSTFDVELWIPAFALLYVLRRMLAHSIFFWRTDRRLQLLCFSTCSQLFVRTQAKHISLVPSHPTG